MEREGGTQLFPVLLFTGYLTALKIDQSGESEILPPPPFVFSFGLAALFLRIRLESVPCFLALVKYKVATAFCFFPVSCPLCVLS